MSVLTIVRHGQASFFGDDYDRLSAVGEEQCRLLGRYWGDLRLTVHHVYTGPRVRQQRSAELAGAAYQRSGLAWPRPVVRDDLDEYDLEGLVNRFAVRLAERDPDFQRLMEAHRRASGAAQKMRSFQRMFECLLNHWQLAKAPGDDLEGWLEFRGRVRRAIQSIQAESGRNQRVAVFTSGGVVGCAAQHALGATDSMMLELNWRVRNSSLTEFLYTRDRFTLDSFNTVPHLNDQALWTYR